MPENRKESEKRNLLESVAKQGLGQLRARAGVVPYFSAMAAFSRRPFRS